ncbi:MAG: bifunctional diaminohydroxyphosphoribosylaminopyrimidine deaminase/5-amino-6-(5-phosphoribosylamino)uracil reductase RibD [Planctomycetes bacterium]|nr:bifunctional diaminohydroxyphosphoribosylaminopyrimidine deaminase/5-amino-6-(5-phosphoribosylamino)uracil reductase RibD [Planctomycetota bacterium]
MSVASDSDSPDEVSSEDLRDQVWMDRALVLAARGDHRARPNPRVGAVLVADASVLAEGFHEQSGGPHAEAALFALLGDPNQARGATLYLTLEPCGAFAGKQTPPCVEALLPLGLERIVLATLDPHAGTAGRSVARLRAAGVVVEVGVRASAARRLNGPFFKAQARLAAGLPPLPYLSAKWAMSLDGKIACHTGHSQWISGEASRRASHVLRGEVDAVLIGSGTALTDDPRLTRRDVAGGDPLPVVLDRRARLPLKSRLVKAARETGLLVVVGRDAPAERRTGLRDAGVEVLEVEGEDSLGPLLLALGARGCDHVLLEGGGEVLSAAFAGDWVDRALVFVAPRILGGRGAPGPVAGVGASEVGLGPAPLSLEVRASGEDVLLEAHFRLYP